MQRDQVSNRGLDHSACTPIHSTSATHYSCLLFSLLALQPSALPASLRNIHKYRFSGGDKISGFIRRAKRSHSNNYDSPIRARRDHLSIIESNRADYDPAVVNGVLMIRLNIQY